MVAQKPRAFSYLRYSTPEQSKGDSTRRQTALAEQYAAKHGLELDVTLRMRDEGVSAFRGKNSDGKNALGAFRDAVKSGDVPKGSYLLVENLDRLSRMTARAAVRVFEDIVDAGVTVVTLNDGQEYTAERLDKDQLSFLMAVLGFFRGHEESETKSRRLKASWIGKVEKVKQGVPLTSIGPAWLKLNRDKGKFETIPARARIVRRIFRDTLSGVGQNLLAESLNREKVPVFGRGKMWHRSYVQKILNSATVIGTLTPHALEYDAQNDHKRSRKPRVAGREGEIRGYYPQVIEPGVFKRVQALIARRSPLRGRHATSGAVFNLFGSLLRCGRCGSTAILVNKGEPPKGARYIVCSKAKAGAGCKYKTARYDRIEEAFMSDLGALFGTMPATGVRGQEIEQAIRDHEGGLSSIEDAIENLLRAVEKGGKTVHTTARIRELEQQHEELSETLSGLYSERDGANLKSVQARANDLQAALLKSPLDRTYANALMREVFERGEVEFDDEALSLMWRHGGQSIVRYGHGFKDETKKVKTAPRKAKPKK